MKTLSPLQKKLFFLLIVFLPSQLGYHFWPAWSFVSGIRVDYLSPTLYLTDIIVSLLLLTCIKKIKFNEKHIILGLFIFFNIYFSVSPFITIYRYLKMLEACFLIYFVYIHKKEVKENIKIPLIIATTYTCATSILQWLHQGSLGGIFYYLGERNFTVNTPGIALGKIGDVVTLRPYATLPHPNALAGFLLVSLFLIGNTKKITFLKIFIMFVIVLTQSYAVWITAILVFSFKALNLNKLKTTALTKKLIFLFFYYLSLFSPIFFSLVDLNIKNKNTVERILLSVVSGKIISTHLLLGSGLGTFIILLPKYLYSKILLLQPVHNIPLLVFAETGVVGSLLFLFFTLNLELSVPVFIIYFTSLFDHYWITLQSPLLLMAIVMGISYNNSLRS